MPSTPGHAIVSNKSDQCDRLGHFVKKKEQARVFGAADQRDDLLCVSQGTSLLDRSKAFVLSPRRASTTLMYHVSAFDILPC